MIHTQTDSQGEKVRERITEGDIDRQAGRDIQRERERE